MRRAGLLAVVALAGCGGGKPTRAEKVQRSVEAATQRLHHKKHLDQADRALLEIEKSDMPADVKQQLLEAKQLLDKYKGK